MIVQGFFETVITEFPVEGLQEKIRLPSMRGFKRLDRHSSTASARGKQIRMYVRDLNGVTQTLAY